MCRTGNLFMPLKLKQFLLRWINTTVGAVVATSILRHGLHYDRLLDLVVASLLLGILYAFVRPMLMLFTLPLMVLTLGLFTFVINGVLLYFVGWLLQPGFEVRSFGAAFWGALIITIISFVLNTLTGTNTARIKVNRRPPPGPGDGGGPVIDV